MSIARLRDDLLEATHRIEELMAELTHVPSADLALAKAEGFLVEAKNTLAATEPGA